MINKLEKRDFPVCTTIYRYSLTKQMSTSWLSFPKINFFTKTLVILHCSWVTVQNIFSVSVAILFIFDQ